MASCARCGWKLPLFSKEQYCDGCQKFLAQQDAEERKRKLEEAREAFEERMERMHKAHDESERLRIAEEARLAEEARKAEEARLAEETRLAEEEAQKAQIISAVSDQPLIKQVEHITAMILRPIIEEENRIKQINEEKEQEKKQEAYERCVAQIDFTAIDEAIKDSAYQGEKQLVVYFNSITRNDRSMPYIVLSGIDDAGTASILIAQHYSNEGFSSGVNSFDKSATIEWRTEDEIERKRLDDAANAAQAEAAATRFKAELAARLAFVQSALIINSFVSTEGSNGNMTNYVMHTVRLKYVDGTKGIISLRESDPFMRGLIDKLEN